MALTEKRKRELDAMAKAPGLSTQRKQELDAMMTKGSAPSTPLSAWSQQGKAMKAATAVPEAGIGFAKEAAARPGTVAKAGLSLGERLADTKFGRIFGEDIVSLLGPKAAKFAQGAKTALDTSVVRPQAFTPTNAAQKVGAGVEQAAEFALPGTQATKLSRANLIGRSLAEGGEAYTKAALQSGEFGGEAKTAGTIAALTPPALKLAGSAFKALTPSVSKAIEEGITKGLRPGGSKTAPQTKAYLQKAKEAIQTISEYKPLLENADGARVARPPENRRELLEAIDQAKSKIFNEYHTMATKAGGAGAHFNPDAVVVKLQEAMRSKSLNPEVRAYARELIPQMTELRLQSPEIIEARIKDMNSNLGSLYGTDRIMKAKAQVDASVANLMRDELDKIIEKETGPGYQALKNKYGALKAIEKDVARGAGVDVRKGAASTLDITDIFTGGDLLQGALTLNPAQVAKGALGMALKQRIKFLNNPNTYIKRMFDVLEKESTKTPQNAVSRRLFGLPNEPVGALGMGIEDVSGKLTHSEEVMIGDLMASNKWSREQALEALGYGNKKNPLDNPALYKVPKRERVGADNQPGFVGKDYRTLPTTSPKAPAPKKGVIFEDLSPGVRDSLYQKAWKYVTQSLSDADLMKHSGTIEDEVTRLLKSATDDALFNTKTPPGSASQWKTIVEKQLPKIKEAVLKKIKG